MIVSEGTTEFGAIAQQSLNTDLRPFNSVYKKHQNNLLLTLYLQ